MYGDTAKASYWILAVMFFAIIGLGIRYYTNDVIFEIWKSVTLTLLGITLCCDYYECILGNSTLWFKNNTWSDPLG